MVLCLISSAPQSQALTLVPFFKSRRLISFGSCLEGNMRRLSKEQVDQKCLTGHYIMRGKASNKRSQAQRDWHRLQVERVMSRSAAAPKELLPRQRKG